MSKFLQLIKQAYSSSPGDDSSTHPKGQAGYNQKIAEFTRLLPYGLSALEPEGAFVFILNSQGQESNKFGMPSAMQLRKKNLKQGEVAIYNSLTGVWIYLKADGTFEINASGLIDGDVEITGNLVVGGNADIAGNLGVGGNADIAGNLGVGGNAIVNGNISSGGDIITTGGSSNLVITGDADIAGSMVIDGDLTSVTDITVTGELTVDGIPFSTHVHGGVDAGGDDTGGPQ